MKILKCLILVILGLLLRFSGVSANTPTPNPTVTPQPTYTITPTYPPVSTLDASCARDVYLLEDWLLKPDYVKNCGRCIYTPTVQPSSTPTLDATYEATATPTNDVTVTPTSVPTDRYYIVSGSEYLNDYGGGTSERAAMASYNGCLQYSDTFVAFAGYISAYGRQTWGTGSWWDAGPAWWIVEMSGYYPTTYENYPNFLVNLGVNEDLLTANPRIDGYGLWAYSYSGFDEAYYLCYGTGGVISTPTPTPTPVATEVCNDPVISVGDNIGFVGVTDFSYYVNDVWYEQVTQQEFTNYPSGYYVEFDIKGELNQIEVIGSRDVLYHTDIGDMIIAGYPFYGNLSLGLYDENGINVLLCSMRYGEWDCNDELSYWRMIEVHNEDLEYLNIYNSGQEFTKISKMVINAEGDLLINVHDINLVGCNNEQFNCNLPLYTDLSDRLIDMSLPHISNEICTNLMSGFVLPISNVGSMFGFTVNDLVIPTVSICVKWLHNFEVSVLGFTVSVTGFIALYAFIWALRKFTGS